MLAGDSTRKAKKVKSELDTGTNAGFLLINERSGVISVQLAECIKQHFRNGIPFGTPGFDVLELDSKVVFPEPECP